MFGFVCHAHHYVHGDRVSVVHKVSVQHHGDDAVAAQLVVLPLIYYSLLPLYPSPSHQDKHSLHLAQQRVMAGYAHKIVGEAQEAPGGGGCNQTATG